MKIKYKIRKILKPLFCSARNGAFITPLLYKASDEISELISELEKTLKEWKDEAITLGEKLMYIDQKIQEEKRRELRTYRGKKK